VAIQPQGLLGKAGHYARKFRLRRLGVEAEQLTVAAAKTLQKEARPVRLAPRVGLVAELRVCKSPWEVRQIEKALRIQEGCYREFARWLRPGVSERDAAAELRYRLVRAGGEDEAFETMCLWGASASHPHFTPGPRRLRADDLVLLDWGTRVAGYHSDLTRTFFVGRIPGRLRQIHEAVAQAQARAKARVAPGVPFAEVDRAARAAIRRAGFGRYFRHSTGHGLGLRVHEAPRLSARTPGALKAGMVVTVEPGIYLPGVGGVRLEDDLLVTADGHRVLNRLPIGLRWDGGRD
jgi:Xaa-Pro aminopeptidase